MRYLAQIPTSSLSRPNPFPILKVALYCLQIPFANLSETAAPFSFGCAVTRSCRAVNNCNMNMCVRDGCVSYLQIKRFEAGFLPNSVRMRRVWISVFGRRGSRAGKMLNYRFNFLFTLSFM